MSIPSIILASNSPRRKELMHDCGIPFTVESVETKEVLDTNLPIEKAIEQIAYQKAKAVFDIHPKAWVLGCDTMVIYQDQPLGKPKNRADAKRMLELLCGHTHQVISGVAILGENKQLLFHEITEVTFHNIDDEFLKAYLDSEEPYDKAGAYGIQGKGKLLVEKINGDYYNVMGLPIAKVYQKLKKL